MDSKNFMEAIARNSRDRLAAAPPKIVGVEVRVRVTRPPAK